MVESSTNILEEFFGHKGSSDDTKQGKDLFDITITNSEPYNNDNNNLHVVEKVTSIHSSSITRSHSVDNLPLCIENQRQPTNDCLPGSPSSSFHRSMSCAPVDLRQVSSEMPICLLEEDDENDEEIEKIVTGTTNTPASTRVTTPISTTRVDTPLEEEDRYNEMECSSPLPSRNNGSLTVTVSPVPLLLNSSPSITPPPPQMVTTTMKIKSRPTLKKCHESHKLVTPQTRTILRDFLYKQIINKQNGDTSSDNSSRPPVLITSTNSICSSSSSNSTLTTIQCITTGTDNTRNSDNNSGCHHQEMKPSTSFRKNVKKRKLLEPHPPLTSYSVFIRENRNKFSGEVLSSQDMARKLGQMWSSLNQTEKQSYTVKSQIDQYRYLRELKEFFCMKFEGTYKKKDILQLVDDTITNTLQHDNTSLSCGLCKLSFCNLFRKQAHFCGRPHSNELLSTLLKLIPQQLLRVSDQVDDKNKEKSSLDLLTDSNGVNNHEMVQQEFEFVDCNEINEEKEEEDKEMKLKHFIDSYKTICFSKDCPSESSDDCWSSFESHEEEEEERESLCSFIEKEVPINDSLAITVGSVLNSAQHTINQTQANSHLLVTEIMTNQELIDNYSQLLEKEYELKHWSLAYREAIDIHRQEIQANKQHLERLLQLIERFSTSSQH